MFHQFRVSKNVRDKRGGGYHDFRAEFYCLTVPKNFVGETLVFKKCSGIEKFLDNRSITILSKFLVSQCRKTSLGNPSVFQKVSGIEKFYGWEGGGRECHDFPSKICCLTVPKNFVGEPFCVSENFWYRKILWIRGVEGGGGTIRYRKNIWHDRDSNPGPTASEPCCPSPTDVFYFWIKRVGILGLKER